MLYFAEDHNGATTSNDVNSFNSISNTLKPEDLYQNFNETRHQQSIVNLPQQCIQLQNQKSKKPSNDELHYNEYTLTKMNDTLSNNNQPSVMTDLQLCATDSSTTSNNDIGFHDATESNDDSSIISLLGHSNKHYSSPTIEIAARIIGDYDKLAAKATFKPHNTLTIEKEYGAKNKSNSRDLKNKNNNNNKSDNELQHKAQSIVGRVLHKKTPELKMVTNNGTLSLQLSNKHRFQTTEKEAKHNSLKGLDHHLNEFNEFLKLKENTLKQLTRTASITHQNPKNILSVATEPSCKKIITLSNKQETSVIPNHQKNSLVSSSQFWACKNKQDFEMLQNNNQYLEPSTTANNNNVQEIHNNEQITQSKINSSTSFPSSSVPSLESSFSFKNDHYPQQQCMVASIETMPQNIIKNASPLFNKCHPYNNLNSSTCNNNNNNAISHTPYFNNNNHDKPHEFENMTKGIDILTAYPKFLLQGNNDEQTENIFSSLSTTATPPILNKSLNSSYHSYCSSSSSSNNGNPGSSGSFNDFHNEKLHQQQHRILSDRLSCESDEQKTHYNNENGMKYPLNYSQQSSPYKDLQINLTKDQFKQSHDERCNETLTPSLKQQQDIYNNKEKLLNNITCVMPDVVDINEEQNQINNNNNNNVLETEVPKKPLENTISLSSDSSTQSKRKKTVLNKKASLQNNPNILQTPLSYYPEIYKPQMVSPSKEVSNQEERFLPPSKTTARTTLPASPMKNFTTTVSQPLRLSIPHSSKKTEYPPNLTMATPIRKNQIEESFNTNKTTGGDPPPWYLGLRRANLHFSITNQAFKELLECPVKEDNTHNHNTSSLILTPKAKSAAAAADKSLKPSVSPSFKMFLVREEEDKKQQQELQEKQLLKLHVSCASPECKIITPSPSTKSISPNVFMATTTTKHTTPLNSALIPKNYYTSSSCDGNKMSSSSYITTCPPCSKTFLPLMNTIPPTTTLLPPPPPPPLPPIHSYSTKSSKTGTNYPSLFNMNDDNRSRPTTLVHNYSITKPLIRSASLSYPTRTLTPFYTPTLTPVCAASSSSTRKNVM